MRELAAAARSTLGGRPMNLPDARSLRDDLRRSTETVGPQMRTEIETALRDLTSDFELLPTRLTSPTGSTLLLGHAENLLDVLRKPQLGVAAWRDVVTAFEGRDAASTCESRISQLRTILEERGHDWSERASRLAEVLNDRAITISRLRGEEPKSWDPRELAGTTEDERVDLGDAVVSEDPPASETVVWFAYSNARLGRPHLSVGALDFYDGEVWDDERVILEGQWPRPPELDDEHRFHLRDKPSPHCVLLRVNLGRTATTTARTRARRVAERIPSLVSSSSLWKLMEGEVAWVAEGGWFGHAAFEDAQEKSIRLATVYTQSDPTGIQLREIEEKLINGLVSRDDAAGALADGFRWHSASREIPDVAQRVAVTVQSLERQFIPTNQDDKDPWHALLKHYVRAFWAWRTFDAEVCNSGLHALSGLEDWMQGGDLEKYDDYRKQFVTDLPDRAYQIHRGRILRTAKQLANELPHGSLQQKLAEQLADWSSDPKAALVELDTLGDRFDALLSRAVRVRNAAVHGGEVVAEVAESVDRFVFGLETLILAARQWALIDGTVPIAIHQRWRIRAVRGREQLDAGQDFASVLIEFGGTPD